VAAIPLREASADKTTWPKPAALVRNMARRVTAGAKWWQRIIPVKELKPARREYRLASHRQGVNCGFALF
jgi:hypothetical protein